MIRLILSPQDQRAALAENPMSYAAPIVDLVLDGLLDSRQALWANSGSGRGPARVVRGLAQAWRATSGTCEPRRVLRGPLPALCCRCQLWLVRVSRIVSGGLGSWPGLVRSRS